MINTWFDSKFMVVQKSLILQSKICSTDTVEDEIPCDTCEFATQCEVNGTEWTLHWVWANTGSYKIDKVGKNLKKVA